MTTTTDLLADLAHVLIGGRKYYPIAELKAFIARRVRRPNQRAA